MGRGITGSDFPAITYANARRDGKMGETVRGKCGH
jgi:hypothetical protein